MIIIKKEALERIELLEQKYVENWSKNIDYTVIPVGISPKMVQILDRVVDTGESIIVGYNKI